MDEPLHDIDRLFRDSLEPEAQPPSDGVWAKINAGLDNAERQIPFVKNIWTKRLVPMIFLMGLCFIGHRSTTRQQKNNITTKTKVENHIKDNKTAATVFQKQTGAENIANDTSNLWIKKTKSQQRNSNGYDEATVHHPTSTNGNEVASKLPANLSTNHIPSSKTIDHIAIVDKKRKNIIVGNKKETLENAYKNSIGNDGTNHFTTNNGLKGSIYNKERKADKGNMPDHMAENKSGDHFLLPVPWAETRAVTSGLNGVPTILNGGKSEREATSLTSGHLSTKKQKTDKQFGQQKSRWYVSMFAAQEWQGYELQDNDDHPTQQTVSDNRNSIKHREDEDPSLAVGLNLGYQINKKISLETGIRFGGYQIRTDSAKLYAQNNNGGVEYKLTTSSGYAYLNGIGGSLPMAGDSIVAQRVKQSISYIGIPVLFRYKIGNGKINFNPALGLVFNFITGSTVSANLGNGVGNDMQRVQLQGLKNLSVVVMLNPSVYYRWNSHISFGVEPYFNYNISPINNTNVVKSYPYGIGLGVGIMYHF